MQINTFNKIEMWFWRIWKPIAIILAIIFVIVELNALKGTKFSFISFNKITPQECSVAKMFIGQQVYVGGKLWTVVKNTNTGDALFIEIYEDPNK